MSIISNQLISILINVIIVLLYLLINLFYSVLFIQNNKRFIFSFPKSFPENNEIINDYENELGKEIKWIIISPYMKLQKNIKTLNEKDNIICFIGYYQIFDHKHDKIYLYLFSRFYDIVYSSNELIEQLFILGNVFDVRKKIKL